VDDIQAKKLKAEQQRREDEQRQLKAQMELERLELEADIQAATAEEETLAQYLDGTGSETRVKQPLVLETASIAEEETLPQYLDGTGSETEVKRLSTFETAPHLPSGEDTCIYGPGPSHMQQPYPRLPRIGKQMLQPDLEFEGKHKQAEQRYRDAQLELAHLEDELDAMIRAAVASYQPKERSETAESDLETPEFDKDPGPDEGPSHDLIGELSIIVNGQLRNQETEFEYKMQQWHHEMVARQEKLAAELRHVELSIGGRVQRKKTEGANETRTPVSQVKVEKLYDVSRPVDSRGPSSLNVEAPEWTPPSNNHVVQPETLCTPVVHIPVGPSSGQRELIDAMRLPNATLPKSDGDPMNYWTFMCAFDACVHQSSVSDPDKLNCLLEHCVGKAAKVVRPCALMRPAEGYTKARDLLKTRFGDKYVIAKAWVKKIVDGPL
jgi:hypothetical protein